MERAEPEVRVLGPAQLGLGRVAVTGEKVLGVLALLCIAAGRAVPPDAIGDVLWADDPPRSAETAIRVHVSRLRKLGELAHVENLVLHDSIGYRIGALRTGIDAVRFEELVDAARGETDAEAVETLKAALELWSGEPYAGAPDHDRVNSERRRLEELRLVALEDRCAMRLGVEGPGALVDELVSMVEAEPFRERRTELAARALYGTGRQTEALRLLSRTRAQLLEEVGLDPGPSLRELETKILRQDPDLLPRQHVARRVWRRRLPPAYPPLIGRDDLLRELVPPTRRSVRSSVTVLHGPPGMGKSRLLAELAASRSAVVLYGGCAPTTPLRPVIQLFLNALADDHIGVGALPTPLFRRLTAGDPIQPGTDSTVLAYAAAEAVEELAARERLVLSIDDAHALDDDSELTLRTVLEGEVPLELVCAAWPAGLGDSSAWNRLQSRWPASCEVRTLSLDPLTRIELTELARAADLGTPVDGGVRLASMSGGNPYVALAALRAGGDERDSVDATPADVLERILDRRTPDELVLLQLLALCSEACPIDVIHAAHPVVGVGAVWRLEGHQLVAIEGGLVRLAHELLARSIQHRTGGRHRSVLHAELAHGEQATRTPGWQWRWALHVLHTGAPTAEQSHRLVSAAELALRGGRFDLALTIAQRWLDLDVAGCAEQADDMRCVLAVAFGRTGDLERAIAILDDVERAAARRGDLDRRITTALRVAELDRMVMSGGDPVPILDRVLADVPVDRVDERVQLATLLLLHLSSPNRTASTVDTARRLVDETHPTDPELELRVLAVRHRFLGQQPEVEPRLAVTRRVMLLADAIGSDRARMQGLLMSITNDVRRGAHAEATEQLQRLTAAAERSREPIWLWHSRLVSGCVSELTERRSGDAASDDAARLARRYRIPDGAEAATVWAFLRGYTDGELSAFAPLARSAAERVDNPAWSAAAALCLVDSGDTSAISLLRGAWARRGVLEGTGIWLIHCCLCLEAAARIGEERVREGAVRIVAPFSGQWAVLGSASSCFGPIDRFLAVATTSPDRDHHLKAARAQAADVCSTTWLAVIDREVGSGAGGQREL